MIAALGLARRFWPIIWPILLAISVAGALYAWHFRAVTAAFNDGAAKQAAADRAAYLKAETAATEKQAKLVSDTAAKAGTISKGTDVALQKRYTDLAGSYDALRLRWEAYRADQGRARQGRATGAPGAAAVAADAYCAASGWVSLDVAAAAAEAADTAIAKDDAWRAWWTAQEQAWPKP